MIIDVHSHNFALSVAARAMSGMCHVLQERLYPSGDGTLTNHLDFLDLAGVDKAVLCPIATKPAQFDIIFRRACDILSGAAGERAQRKIIPFASIHPNDPDWAAHLETIARAGIKGVKFHPYYQGFSLADPAFVPLFEKIADLGLVVQCHCGHDIGYDDPYPRCGPHEVAVLLRRVPALTFIAAHLGGCLGYAPHATDELLTLGAYIDTSVLARTWHKDEEMRLVRSWPRERLLFATDFPWVNYTEALSWVASIREKDDLPLIFGGNAARLLSL